RDVFHIKAPSIDGYVGRSIVSECREAIGMALILEEHGVRLFSSGARPSGVLETEKQIGDEGIKRLLKGWKAAHEGHGNSGKTAVLYDGNGRRWRCRRSTANSLSFAAMRWTRLPGPSVCRRICF